MILQERNISKNEKLYQLLQDKFETFSIQFILEGTGDLNEYEFEKAIEKSFEYTSLINVKLRGKKWLSCGLPKIINLKDTELSLNHDVFRRKHNIKKDGTCTIYLFKNAIVFNVFHGVVDGKGIQIWIENIFKILSNKIPIEETSFENDDEFLKRFSTFYNAKNIKPDVTIPKDNSNKKSRFFRIELPYKNKDIIYLIGKAITDSLSSGKQRFMIPTDTRKYNKESIITSNLVRPILLNINEGDNINSIREHFLNSLRNKEELSRFNEKLLTTITKNSLIGKGAINLVTFLQDISNVNLGTGTISNLGEVDLKNYSYKDFETKKIYSIPIVQPYAPISINVIENNSNTQMVLGVYKGYLTEEIINNIIFKIKNEIVGESKTITESDDLLYQIAKNIQESSEKIAIIENQNSYSYKDLSLRINSVILALKEKGYGEGDEVVVSLDRGVDFISSILAVMFLGGSFIPISPESLDSKLQNITKFFPNKILITNRDIIYDNTINIKEVSIDIKKFENLEIIKNRLAYTIFTSGSSGVPKGVKISRESLNNYLKWSKDYYNFSTSDCFAFFSSIDVDLTITSYLLPLYVGGKISIFNSNNHLIDLKSIVNNKDVSFLKLTPTHLKLLNKIDCYNSSIKKLIVGGEVLEKSLVQDTYNHFKNLECIYNEYGPTETTIGVTCHRILKEELENLYTDKIIPIGKPIYNTKIMLINNEIYILGASLGDGYINDLKENNYINLSEYQAYKTNDLAYFNSDNDIVCLERIGYEIKYNGHMINTLEINEKLKQVFDSLEHIQIKNDNGISKLYLVTQNKDLISDVLSYIQSNIQKLSIKKIYWTKNIPISDTGKLDYTNFKLYQDLEVNHKQISHMFRENDVDTLFICSKIKEILNIGSLSLDSNFFELGGDSVDYISLQMEIIKEYQLDIIQEKNLIELMAENYNNLTIIKIISSLKRCKKNYF